MAENIESQPNEEGNLPLDPETNVKHNIHDTLFKFIFGNPDHKNWVLELYNAINGSHYTNERDLQLRIIENAVYLGMRNDVSFLIDNVFSFYEQQSTVSENMPLRFFILYRNGLLSVR